MDYINSQSERGYPYKPSAGFSLLELLVTLSILGILAAIGIVKLQPQSDKAFANDLKIMIQQARFEAIKQNTPVAVIWNARDEQFETKLTPGSMAIANVCDDGQLVTSKSTSDYPQLLIAGDLQHGIVWLPNGSARKCDGTLPAASYRVAKAGSSVTYSLTVRQSGHIDIDKLSKGSS